MAAGFSAASIAGGLIGVANTITTGASIAGAAVGSTLNAAAAIGGAVSSITGMFGGNFGGGFGPVGYNMANLISPTTLLSKYVSNAYSENGVLRFLYHQLFQELMPDISGYTLLFMVPPDLSGYKATGNNNYDTNGTSFMTETASLYPLLATNFSPPMVQLNTGQLAGAAGTQHYATELNITDSMSITYIDTIELDIYSFHQTWLSYIFHVLEGSIDPSGEYLTSRKIDYCGSFYFVKFQPDLDQIQYVGKAIGCFPKELPAQEVLGSRSSNELTNITFNYTVSDYREATMKENNNWLFTELQNLIISKYSA